MLASRIVRENGCR